MKIVLNGEETELENNILVNDLLIKFALEPKKIAVERNLEIVSRTKFDSTTLNEGDRVEIIHFIGGG